MSADKNGFTLIELIVVIIIIGILAAVAVPIMLSNERNAILTEAVAALGSIRTAQRLYFVEHSIWAGVGTNGFTQPNNPLSDYIRPGDLNGTYFSEECYESFPLVGNSWLAICYPERSLSSKAPKADKVAGWGRFIAMDENGTINNQLTF